MVRKGEGGDKAGEAVAAGCSDATTGETSAGTAATTVGDVTSPLPPEGTKPGRFTGVEEEAAEEAAGTGERGGPDFDLAVANWPN